MKNYSVTVDAKDGKLYRKYTVVPRRYRLSCLLNLLIFAALNAAVACYTDAKLSISHFTKMILQLLSVALSLILIRNPTIESLYVFRQTGIQMSTMAGCVLLPRSLNERWLEQTIFIPNDRIVDLVINEGFTKGFQVIFYMAVILKDATKLQLVFPVC
ncbi:LADA_0E10880g1_1 [Lachancea dasiensis]|uniref:LADA_0E10880g1_1 n=1 Tax=Lachancea dasiensis TaxID=1072105 RepID=A0A1G4JF07_9SACH|nr:LADA_0E10880g1_1 [Lachancea dasiensis]